ncbi:class I SAM-dependent methyltransferase [Allosphingosinicella indica]|uniref:Methyltransferase domain-containing protein n=1 Tax=Allosphingosinicella indica TaxID=941907 RepID=A0A1X7GBA5_9SPHN|nr:class I SAM-dependent methyltransferase [Allosphingosinicella indica]SMF67151.1 Methyltransferase domain-containing protein [Allosphingosinicella indica]
MERAVYERMAAIDGEHWWFAARRQILTDLIRRLDLPQSPRILEVGAGTGSNLEMLKGFGRVDAIEPDDPARALASRRSGIDVMGGMLPDGVKLEDGAYDLIVLLDVLEHIPDDEGTLKALRSKLAPGGRLMVSVPASPWMWSAHDVAHHHQRRYTAAGLEKVFRAAGYRTAYRSHFNTLLFPLIAAARLAGKLTKREGGDDAIPPKPLNGLLKTIFGAERHAIGRASLPFGVSLALVAVPTTR